MIENRLQIVFETMRRHEVACLLMGGQACVIYGAAEFSKDIDFAILASEENLARLGEAMSELQAKVIAVPPFESRYLGMGLAVHFRCHAKAVQGLRIDLMTRMRGVDSFEKLWERRFSVRSHQANQIHLLSLPDLVNAKKTQRDKDWPMIRRLLEVNYLTGPEQPSEEDINFWLLELRTPELLLDAVARFPEIANQLSRQRALLAEATAGNLVAVENLLIEEMRQEMQQDQNYWNPLKEVLRQIRHGEL